MPTPFKCEKCGAALGWTEPRICDKCQPKPTTREWTAQRVREIRENTKSVSKLDWDNAIADAHNAALAAAQKPLREKLEAFFALAFKEGVRAAELEQQLAAEREKLEREKQRNFDAELKLRDDARAITKQLRDLLAAEREKAGTWTLQDGNPKLLDGDIEKLKSPDYHQLNKHAGRNDRLLHAVLCAYIKHHYYEDNHIGWDELDDILLHSITNEIGDDAFCEWSDKLK